MSGTSGLATALIVFVVLASLAGLWVLAVSVLHRVSNQVVDDVARRTPTTTIDELTGRDEAE
jgi:hypothetical protein